MIGLGLSLTNVAATSGGGAPAPATLDPGSTGGTITFTNGNLTATTSGASASGTRSSRPLTAGAKIYFEVTANVTADALTVGIINASASYTPSFWWNTASANTASATPGGNNMRYNTNVIGITSGTDIGIAYNDTTKKLYCSIAGVWQNSADPVAGTGGLDCTGLTGTLYVGFQGDSGDKATFNFGGSAYNHTPPTGYGNL